MMMKCVSLFVFLISLCMAFQPMTSPAARPTTALYKVGGKPQKMDRSVFDGRAPRITIRQDEDAAMWIDDKETPKAKSPAAAGKKTPPAKSAPSKSEAPKKKGFFGLF